MSNIFHRYLLRTENSSEANMHVVPETTSWMRLYNPSIQYTWALSRFTSMRLVWMITDDFYRDLTSWLSKSIFCSSEVFSTVATLCLQSFSVNSVFSSGRSSVTGPVDIEHMAWHLRWLTVCGRMEGHITMLPPPVYLGRLPGNGNDASICEPVCLMSSKSILHGETRSRSKCF